MPEDMPGQSGGLPLTIPGSAMDTTARCPAYVTSPAVAVAACPAQCSQCVNGTCLLRCGGVGQCSDMDFDCPDGYRCRIECSGFSNCSNLEVECAEDAPCEVVCEGFDTCEGLRMKCGDQACAVRCTGSRPQQVRLEADDACGSVLDC